MQKKKKKYSHLTFSHEYHSCSVSLTHGFEHRAKFQNEFSSLPAIVLYLKQE